MVMPGKSVTPLARMQSVNAVLMLLVSVAVLATVVTPVALVPQAVAASSTPMPQARCLMVVVPPGGVNSAGGSQPVCRLPGRNGGCYSGVTAVVAIMEPLLGGGMRILVVEDHRELANW